MPRASNDGIELEYDTFGDPTRPALLLVMGFTAQMTAWEEAFCQRLADGGRFVIRFDNRDCGLSTKLDGATVDLAAVLGVLAGGEPPAGPYTLSDMAADAVAVLDHLGVAKAHIVGASMGGMIVQTIAIEHPERVLTLTSVMSNTGELEFGLPTPEALGALLRPPPADRAAYVQQAVDTWKVWSSPRYYDPDKVAKRAGDGYDRSFYPEGAMRQLGAVAASGSRAEGLQALDVPTLVIHGRADSLITLGGGNRTAELVPGANLLVLNDMGHDLPEPLWPTIVDAVLSHTTNAI